MEKLKEFIEEKINKYATTIVDTQAHKYDMWAFGELGVYLHLREFLASNPTQETLDVWLKNYTRHVQGAADAVNDTLQYLGKKPGSFA